MSADPSGFPFPTLVEGAIGGVPQLVCDAHELHASLRPGTRYAQWLKHRIASLRLREGIDYAPAGILPNLRNNSRGRGRPFQSTLFTAEAAKLVAAAERNPIGNAILRHLVRCEDELRRVAPDRAAALDDALRAAIPDPAPSSTLGGADGTASDGHPRTAGFPAIDEALAEVARLRTLATSLSGGLEVLDLKLRLAAVTAERDALAADPSPHAAGGFRPAAPRAQGVASDGAVADAVPPTAPARLPSPRRRGTVVPKAELRAAALRIIAEAGLTVSPTPTCGPMTDTEIASVDSVMRLVATWGGDAALVILRALAANGQRVARMTVVIRALSGFPSSWVGHASYPWFAKALVGMDFFGVETEVVANGVEGVGQRFVAARAILMARLGEARRTGRAALSVVPGG